jgi:hypothetical protein
MPSIIARLIDWTGFAVVARIVLTFPFWASGLSKSIGFSAGVAEMKQVRAGTRAGIQCCDHRDAADRLRAGYR